MNYFDNLKIEENVTVLGADENSEFVKELREFAGKNITVTAPDKVDDGRFKVHTEEEIDAYKEAGKIIGVMDINILEKRICDVIDGVRDFCEINDLFDDELICPLNVARVVAQREYYDILYINNVDTESKRFLAREVAKRFATSLIYSRGLRGGSAKEAVEKRHGDLVMGIRLINTDTDYVETLVK